MEPRRRRSRVGIAALTTTLLLLLRILLPVALAARPPKVTIGALFAFDSVIGRSARAAIALAVDDVNRNAAVLSGTSLSVVMHDTKCDGFIGSIQALELMENEVVAVLGPQSSGIAHVLTHVVNELHVPLISFAATDPALSSGEYPYFFRAAHDDSSQMAAVADLVAFYRWREVTAVYVDNDYGRGAVNALGDALEAMRSKISFKAAFAPGADRAALTGVLLQANMTESRVFVVHASPDSGLDVFAAARELGMLAAGYAWIATDWLTAAIESSASSPSPPPGGHVLQGVVTLRQYTADSAVKRTLLSRLAGSGVAMNAYGLYAYDAVWTAARAIDAFLRDGGSISFSADLRLHDANRSALRLSGLRVFDQGDQLLQKVMLVNFTGATGPVRFGGGRFLMNPAYEVLNVGGGSGLRRVGNWSNDTGLSADSQQRLRSVVWPGKTKTPPRGWVFPDNGRPLRIAVPYRTAYPQFVSKDGSPDGVSGYCVDVFKAAVRLLPYRVPATFVLFGDGSKNPNYGALVQKVAAGTFDAAVGDIAIVTNRTRVVDFTQPYAESGLVIVVSSAAAKAMHGSSNAWAFLRPFTPEMWATTAAFFVFVGAVVWVLEHRFNPEFGGTPREQMATVFWFSFSTMFFKQRERTVSTLGRCVLIIWLFVVLVVNSSYKASLTSMMTVQQLSTGIQDMDSLRASVLPIGYQVGSYAKSYLMQEVGVRESRLRELSIGEYAQSLATGAVAAIVDEQPYVELFLSANCQFKAVGQELTKSGWGFAFQRDSPLAVDLSRAILTLSENGDLQRIHDKWLSAGTCASQAGGVDADRLDLHSFWGLFLVCGAACFAALLVFLARTLCQYCEYRKELAGDGAAFPAMPQAESSSSSSRRPAWLKGVQELISFADMKETLKIKKNRSGERLSPVRERDQP